MMPEIGTVRHFGTGVHVYLTMWQGHPPTLVTGWFPLTPGARTDNDLFEEVENLPDGAVLDVPMLRQGKVVVVSKPRPEQTQISDDTLEALLREADCHDRSAEGKTK